MDPRGKGVGQLNVCWSQPFVPFTTAAGTLADFGDLPACKQRDQVAPCILGKTSGQGGKVGFIRILATAIADPKLYGH
jgi:hypothetical protein